MHDNGEMYAVFLEMAEAIEEDKQKGRMRVLSQNPRYTEITEPKETKPQKRQEVTNNGIQKSKEECEGRIRREVYQNARR